MKKGLFLILISILAIQVCAFAQVDQKALYQKKIKSYSNMKGAGIGLTFGGVVMTAIGIGVIAGAPEDDWDTYEDESYDQIMLGAVVTEVGVIMIGGGITLWAIGGSKKAKYTRKLNALSLNLNPSFKQKFSLAYRF